MRLESGEALKRLLSSGSGILMCFMISGCASTPKPQEPVPAVSNTLLERLQQMAQQEETPDFWELREEFSRSDAYDPYGNTELDELAEKAFASLKEGDPSGALVSAKRMLDLSPLHPKAHVVASRAAEDLGDVENVAFHEWVLAGLLDSICGERSGLEREDPCPVIATYEEYFFLYSNGFRVMKQGLGECAGRECDRMSVEDPETGKQYTFFFDISRPMQHLGQQLGGD